MKKKARFYLGFFICSGERVKTVFTCSRVFLSLICTNARTRINTGFFVHSLISLSQAVRGRTGQVANAALGRRSWLRDASPKARAWVRDRTGQAAFLRSARAGPSAQVGWRQVKVLPAFSKGRYVPVGRCPAADRGGSREAGFGAQFAGGKRPAPTEPAGETSAPRPSGGCGAATSRWDVAQRPTEPAGETRRSCLPLLPKKGGTDVPLLGWHRARSFCLRKGRAGWHRDRSRGYLLRSMRPVRCIFPPAAPG